MQVQRHRRVVSYIFVLMLLSLSQLVHASNIEGVRIWPAPDHTRLVFDLDAPVDHTLFSLKNPNRIVIDLKYADFDAVLPVLEQQNFIKNIRFAKRGDNDLRIVLDLNRSVKPKSFVLKPHRQYGHRLVIDLVDENKQIKKKREKRQDPNQQGKQRDVIVAIDAGHGGDDPGAIGRKGTKEKTVVLAIAIELKRLIDAQPGMRAVLIRDGDYFISLGDRVVKAREQRADLFISIHADAFDDSSVKGSSVFVLTENGASSDVARFLAKSENNSDLIGGVSLDDKPDLLKVVIVDMVKSTTMQDSHTAATYILDGISDVGHLHKKHVEKAGFRVLRAPDIPSILVETAFISNPREEKKLRSKSHQKRVARAIFKGTLHYFEENPPAGSYMAMQKRKHRITRGETLSGIADMYEVTIADIRRLNSLKNDRIRVGDVLSIPSYAIN